MGKGYTYNLIGYGPVKGTSRRMYTAMSLLDAFQEELKAHKEGELIEEWTYQTETGRRMLRLGRMDIGRKAKDMLRPRGLVACPKCSTKGCQICRWSGMTTRRWLVGFRPWQLEPEGD